MGQNKCPYLELSALKDVIKGKEQKKRIVKSGIHTVKRSQGCLDLVKLPRKPLKLCAGHVYCFTSPKQSFSTCANLGGC